LLDPAPRLSSTGPVAAGVVNLIARVDVPAGRLNSMLATSSVNATQSDTIANTVT
jgi:hypothetical protein